MATDYLKQLAKSIIGNYVQGPYPDSYRAGWDEVGLYGVSRPTVENVIRRNYNGLLNNFAGNPFADRLRAQNELDMVRNEMIYNPNFYQMYTE